MALVSQLKTLVYVKPDWNVAGEGFPEEWSRFLAGRNDLWGDKAEKESIQNDRSVAILTEDIEQALTVTKTVHDVLGKTKEGAFLPVQLIIDWGPYLAGDDMALEYLDVDWEQIQPGEIYVSPSVFKTLEKNPSLGVKSESQSHDGISFVKIVFEENGQDSTLSLFHHHDALAIGENDPCYYCGARRHLARDCPSKKLDQTTSALERLGYLSFDEINRFFNDYVSRNTPGGTAEIDSSFDPNNPLLLVHHGFYELKRVFQLSFLRRVWDDGNETWEKIRQWRARKKANGGVLWMGTDCLRVSNLAQAESFLEAAVEQDPDDFRPHCAMGFLNVERNNFLSARYHFVKALDCADTKSQKVFIRLLICRLYDVEDYASEAAETLGEILAMEPNCVEAMYQDIVYRFREGQDSEAMDRLGKLIELDRQFFINALIDPGLAPFGHLIQPFLSRVFGQAKNEATGILDEARKEYKKAKEFDDKIETEDFRAFWARVKEAAGQGSFFGYLDAIHSGRMFISLCRKNIDRRRQALFETLHGLNSRIEESRVFVKKYRYPGLVDSLRQRLMMVDKEIWETKEMAKSESASDLRKSLSLPAVLSAELDGIESKLKRLGMVQLMLVFLTTFVKRSLIFQAVIVFVAIVLFPVAVYYLNMFLPKYQISPVKNIWSYQQGILIVGGICAGLFALISTANGLDKDSQ